MAQAFEGVEHRDPEPSREGPARRRTGAPGGELHCPRCGGLLRRRWSGVCVGVFVVFFITALLSLVGLPVGMTAQSWGDPRLLGWYLGMWSGSLAVVFLIAMPIAGALAVHRGRVVAFVAIVSGRRAARIGRIVAYGSASPAARSS
jgi:hypothetical protein